MALTKTLANPLRCLPLLSPQSPTPMADEPSYETHHKEETSHKKKKKSSKRKHLDVSVEFIKDAPDRTAPVVGYFSTGFDPLASDDNAVCAFRHSRKTNCMDLVVRPSGSSLEFVGTSYKGEAEPPRICTYALGVLDKDSQTLKIVPIATNKVFRLEPYLAEKESTHPEQSDVTEATPTGKVGRKMADLTNMFGSRKDKSQQKKFQNLLEQINTDAPDGEQHIGASQDYASEAETEVSRSSSFGTIPPHNLTANEPEQAYPLDQIIPRGERPYLLNILNDINNKKNYPSFVANRMHQLKSQSDEKKEELACIFSYITHLITFWEMHRSSKSKYDRQRSGENRMSIPQIVFQKLMVLFMNSESNVLSTEKNELLIGYILVLTLFADNFKSETTDIAKDLKMTWQVLKLYYSQLGCKVKGTFVTLPVPLRLPDMRTRKRKQPRQ